MTSWEPFKPTIWLKHYGFFRFWRPVTAWQCAAARISCGVVWLKRSWVSISRVFHICLIHLTLHQLTIMFMVCLSRFWWQESFYNRRGENGGACSVVNQKIIFSRSRSTVKRRCTDIKHRGNYVENDEVFSFNVFIFFQQKTIK